MCGSAKDCTQIYTQICTQLTPKSPQIGYKPPPYPIENT